MLAIDRQIEAEVLLPLTEHDHCDRCPAQALVRVQVGTGVLDFCGHHYREHGIALASAGHTVIDLREGAR